MKIVIDTNVVLDVLAERHPFFERSRMVMALASTGQVTAGITANTITDISYLLGRHGWDTTAVKNALMNLMELVDVLDVTRERCIRAFRLPMFDYEDALLAECAEHWGAEYIVTRNLSDFEGAPVPSIAPEAFLTHLS